MGTFIAFCTATILGTVGLVVGVIIAIMVLLMFIKLAWGLLTDIAGLIFAFLVVGGIILLVTII